MRSSVFLAALAAVCALTPLPAAHASTVVPCSRGTVALTFDDGPRIGTTARVLDVLRAAHVHATFFEVGSNVAANPDLTRRVLREGHTVGDHTYRHEDLLRLPSSSVRTTLRQTQNAVARATGGSRMTLFRPPYGATNGRVRSVGARLGLHQVLWTVDPQDWQPGRSRSTIASNVLTHLRRDSIVLLHDGVGNSAATAAALPTIIASARARGFCFGTLTASGVVAAPVPRARLYGTQVDEPAKGDVRAATLTVRLSEPTTRPVSVVVRTAPGTATSGADFRALYERLTIPSGAVRASVTVLVRGDAVAEPRESFTVNLSRPSHAVVRDGTATVRITDFAPSP